MVTTTAIVDTIAVDSETPQAAIAESELPDEMTEREGDKSDEQQQPDDVFGELEDEALKRF
jgi:hypothetical protein